MTGMTLSAMLRLHLDYLSLITVGVNEKKKEKPVTVVKNTNQARKDNREIEDVWMHGVVYYLFVIIYHENVLVMKWMLYREEITSSRWSR